MASSPQSPQSSACWICGSQRLVRWKDRGIKRPLRPEDLQITDHRYGLTLQLRRCRECGFICAAGDELPELVRLYAALSDPGYEASTDTRALQMQELLDHAQRLRRGAASLLDVGAAAGMLVAEGRRRGLRAAGIEPSAALVRHAQEHFGVELVCGTLPHPALSGQRFDLVFAVDVIEHVADPVGLLRACADRLAPDGVLIVVTPDVNSLAARALGRRWWHYRLAHVGYFGRRSLTIAARRAGLRPVSFVRACWCFRVRYLADRLAEYLPIGWLNRAAERSAVLRRLYSRRIRLNLLDSWVTALRHDPESEL